MQGHGVPVLKGEFLAAEVLHGREHFAGRRPSEHGEYDLGPFCFRMLKPRDR